MSQHPSQPILGNRAQKQRENIKPNLTNLTMGFPAHQLTGHNYTIYNVEGQPHKSIVAISFINGETFPRMQ